MQRSNSRIAGGISSTNPHAASWEALDRLPPRLRHLLWEAPVSINPLSAERLLDSGVSRAADQLTDAIRKEVRLFGAEYRKRHGHDLPHLAAEASLQPYAAVTLSSSRHRRRRRC